MTTKLLSWDEVMGGAPLQAAPRPSSKPFSYTPESADDEDNKHHLTFRELANTFGAQITSLNRTPEKNKQVRGVTNSQHMSGTAGDFVVPADKKDAFRQAAIERGYEAIDEGDHIHLELPKSSSTPKKASAPALLSFEDVMGTPTEAVGTQPMDMPAIPEEGEWDALKRIGKNTFEHIMQKVNARNGGQGTQWVERKEPEIRRLWLESMKSTKNPLPYETFKAANQFVEVSTEPTFDREQRWRALIEKNPQEALNLPADLKHLAPRPDTKGMSFIDSYMANMKGTNLSSLLLEDSLPADFVIGLANAPENERKRFEAARKVTQQEYIVANPDKFPAVSVEEAQKAIDRRKAEQGKGIGAMWRDLKQAAQEDSGRMGAEFTKSLLADPEMLAAPIGLGVKPIQFIKGAKSASELSRVARVADRILDAGNTAGALNVAMEGAEAFKIGEELTSGEALNAYSMGMAIGGPLGAIFLRGAKARDANLKDARLNGTLDQILRDRALADLETESIIQDEWNGGVDAATQKRTNEMLGITKETDRAKRLEEYRDSIKKTFKDEADYADYLKAKAKERVHRRTVLAEEAKGRGGAAKRQAARPEGEVDSPQTTPSPIEARFQQTLDELGGVESLLRAAKDRNATKLSKLRVPAEQAGRASQDLMKAMGISAAAATAGAAMYPEDPKQGALAGLLLSGLAYGRGSRDRLAISKISQQGAIRLRGEGEWSPHTQHDMTWHIAPEEGSHPVEWANKAVKNYLNKYAGTPEDPLKDIVLPSGDRWEDIIDQALKITKNSTQDNYPYEYYKAQLNIPENVDKPIFALQSGYENNNKLMDYLAHVGDYIMQEVPAAKLPQYDLVRAVKETAAWDAANLKKAEAARVKSDKNLTVVKTYEDGTRWVKLDKPGQFAAESDIMGHSVRGYEPTYKRPMGPGEWAQKTYDYPHGDAWKTVVSRFENDEYKSLGDFPEYKEYVKTHEESQDWIPESGDSGYEHYGHGGWEAIKSGEAQIYSLRDKDGRSHVTIEVEHRPANKQFYDEVEQDHFTLDRNYTAITQIKGKGNAKPAAKYIPYVQDFVKSGKWEDVEDLYNTDLFDIKSLASNDATGAVLEAILEKEFGKSRYYTSEQVNKAKSYWPKNNQSGKASPELLARIGAIGILASAGYALAPSEQKLAGSSLGALAGLVVPGGGRSSVLRRMYQSGAINADGDIVGMLVKAGKLVADRSTEQVLKDERALIERFKAGDQRAFQQIYEENKPRLVKFARRYIKENGARLGIDAEDIVQEAFVKIHKALPDFESSARLNTWMSSIVQNEALMAIRAGKAEMRGGDAQIISADPIAMRDEFGEGFDKSPIDELGVADEVTPQRKTENTEAIKLMQHALNKLPKDQQEVLVMREFEGMEYSEIAEVMGVPEATVRKKLQYAKESVAKSIERGYGAVPLKQRGAVDQRLLKVGALAALGAGAGAYLNRENRELGMSVGAMLGLGLGMKGARGKSLAREGAGFMEDTFGLVSTRLMNKSRPLWMRALQLESRTLRKTHEHIQTTGVFLKELKHLPTPVRNVVTRAILTGDRAVTERIIDAISNPALTEGWKSVRGTLDSLADQLVALKRFKRGGFEYFPRIVKDLDGLLGALGKSGQDYLTRLLDQENTVAIKKRGSGLSDLERSIIINNFLKSEAGRASQPGFAKDRGVEEITEELQKYYATPAESLHTYIQQAVADIEKAHFFGADLRNVKKNGLEFIDTEKSVGELVRRLVDEGKITGKDAEEIRQMLFARFSDGERSPNAFIQGVKNLGYVGLLGNTEAGITQLGDVALTAYAQGLLPMVEGAARTLAGRKLVDLRSTGLIDHVAEEFANVDGLAKLVKTVFYTGMTQFDRFGKNTSLNAALINFRRMAKSERGINELADRYGDALGQEDFAQLIKDLNAKQQTDLVDSILFAELSRTQPISRMEMPVKFLQNPNGRVLYMLKTFTLKMFDLARRDAYNEIKRGNYLRGTKNLMRLGIYAGLGGATTAQIKSMIFGGDVDGMDIFDNALKSFGLGQYIRDKMLGVSETEAAERKLAGDENARPQKAQPAQALTSLFVPPVKIVDDTITAKHWSTILKYTPLAPWAKSMEKDAKAQEKLMKQELGE